MPEMPEHRTISRAEYNRRLAVRRKRKRRRRIRAGIIALAALSVLIAGIVLIYKSCFAEDPIVGTWDHDTVTVYRFEKGGEGALELPNGSYGFFYKTDADQLVIDFVSESAADSTYTFRINDDTLTLIDDDGTCVLKKK